MPEEPSNAGSKGKGAFARILRSEVLLHTKNATSPESVESQLTGWGFDVRTQRSLGAISIAIAAATADDAPPKIVLLDHPTSAVIEDLRITLEEAGTTPSILWILVNPDGEARTSAGALGASVKIVEGVESNLFDAMVWASSLVEEPESEKSSAPAAPRALPANPTGRRGRVLLVEDNEINRMVVEEILTDTDLELDFAENGREAVDKVSAGRFDVVLMDCQMPVLDGFEATREIRSLEAGGVLCHESGRIPIIALTANAIRGDQARCLAAGMDDYLTKPFDDAHLIDLIGRYLEPRAAATATSETPEVAAASPEPMKQSSCFAVKECLGRCAGNLDLAKRLIGMLIDQAEREIPAIEKAVRNGDLPRAREIAHGLRGAAGNLGATTLHEALTRIEAAVQTPASTLELQTLVAGASAELQRFRETDPLFRLEHNGSQDGTLGTRSLA